MNSLDYRKKTKFTVKKNRKKSKFIGVFFKNNKYYSRINCQGDTYFLGPFNTENQAAKAYDRKKIELIPIIKNCKFLNFYYKKLDTNKRKREREKEQKPNIVKKSTAKKRRFKRYKRRSIRKGELWNTLYKQNWKCNICKKMFPCVPIIDHIIPLQYGGTYRLNNLQGICSLCNSWKTGMFDSQIKNMLTYTSMTPEEILEIQEKVYNQKFNNSNKSSINFNNVNSSTISFTFNR